MSSVGVLMKKKSKYFVKRTKSKCPKENFQSVKRGRKIVSVGFRVFGKKNEIERKVPEKEKKNGWKFC
jgi:hypothetical protein